MVVKITYDPAKRDAALRDRGLDFEDADKVFAGRSYTKEDRRVAYGAPANHRLSRWPNGHGGVDAARRCWARHVDEEMQ